MFLKVKAQLKKITAWCIQHWRWLVLTLGAFLAYMAGSKKQRSLKINAELARDQYKREVEMIEKEKKAKRRKLIKAEIQYQTAMRELDKKYEDANSHLQKEKDLEYRRQIDAVRNDPEELDKLLIDMGIKKVKKS
tara:strand:+ start:5285 stop:5689 length:405 start_codon:yes stop_codon:yes gene_type:complete